MNLDTNKIDDLLKYDKEAPRDREGFLLSEKYGKDNEDEFIIDDITIDEDLLPF